MPAFPLLGAENGMRGEPPLSGANDRGAPDGSGAPRMLPGRLVPYFLNLKIASCLLPSFRVTVSFRHCPAQLASVFQVYRYWSAAAS